MKRLTKFQARQLAYWQHHGSGIVTSNGRRRYRRDWINKCWETLQNGGYIERGENGRMQVTELGKAYVEKYNPDWTELLLDSQALTDYDKQQLVCMYLNDGAPFWNKRHLTINETYDRLRAHNLVQRCYSASRLRLTPEGEAYADSLKEEYSILADEKRGTNDYWIRTEPTLKDVVNNMWYTLKRKGFI